MTCTQVQQNLSLYLYGELDFSAEEAVESHIAACAFCQLALGREKEWHAGLNDGQQSVPFELLADCRAKLQVGVGAAPAKLPNELWRERLHRYLGSFFQICEQWPARAALAGMLLLIGFGAGRVAALRGGLPAATNEPVAMGLGPFTRIRGVQRTGDGQVHIVMDRIQQSELTGPVSDEQIRRCVLMAARESANPAVRVDSVDVLAGEPGADVQQALLATLQEDPNAAVRMKALEALRPAAASPLVRSALIGVLQRDADPALRSEVIDVLLSGTSTLQQAPEVIQVLRQTSQPEERDDYVRSRSIQFLRMVNGQVVEAY